MKTNHKPRLYETDLTRVTSVLTPHIVNRLDTIAAEKTMSRSLLIRQACEAFLRQCERDKRAEASANA